MQPNKPNQQNYSYGYPNYPQQQNTHQNQNFSNQGQQQYHQPNPNFQQQNPNYQQHNPNYPQQNQSFFGQGQQPYRQPNPSYPQQNNQNQSFSGQGQQQYRQPNPNYQHQQNPNYQQHNQTFPTKPRIKNDFFEQSFISTGSQKTSGMSSNSLQRQMEQKMRIIPKQTDFKSIEVWNEALNTLAQKRKFATNLFEYTGQQNDKVFIYKVQTTPPIRPDATKTWFRIINSIKPLL